MITLKSTGITIGKAVLVALGVPYGIAIVVNSVHGWPQSDISQGRFSKQLRPSRVLSLNYAIIQQMTMVRWLPLVLQADTVHKKANPALKDLPFGDNGLKMDVWQPREKASEETPVVFFIFGGAWGSGYKEIYAKLGQEVADTLDAVVVIPDYRIYPKGNMTDMVHDIVDSIHEFRNQCTSLNHSMNCDKIILMGHSAGAHLCAMTAIHMVSKNREMSVTIGTENTGFDELSQPGGADSQEECVTSIGGEMEGGNVCVDIPCGKSGEVYDQEKQVKEDQGQPFLGGCKEERASLDSAIMGVIGIGGVYHIEDHYGHESKRGVEDLSPMWRAAEGLRNFAKHSPTCVVPGLTEEQKERLPPHMLIHGMNDSTVPESSSSIYADILAEAEVPTQLRILPGGGHADLIMDMMEPSRKWYSAMMGTVMEGMGTFLGGQKKL